MKENKYNWLGEFVDLHTLPPTKKIKNEEPKLSVECIDIYNIILTCEICREIITNKAHVVFFNDQHTNKCFCGECYKTTNYYLEKK